MLYKQLLEVYELLDTAYGNGVSHLNSILQQRYGSLTHLQGFGNLPPAAEEG